MLNTLSLSRETGELDLSAQACVKSSGMKHTHLHTLTRSHNGQNNKHHISSAQGLTWLSGFITDTVCIHVSDLPLDSTSSLPLLVL